MGTSVSPWQLAKMCATYAGDSSVNPRVMAIAALGPDTTYEAVNDFSVVDVYQAAYDGGLVGPRPQRHPTHSDRSHVEL